MKSATVAQPSPERKLSHAALVGQKVLAGLAKAQRIAHALHRARVQQQQVQIAYMLLEDRQKGRPARGVAGRISRKLGGMLSERQVQRYVKKLSGHPI